MNHRLVRALLATSIAAIGLVPIACGGDGDDSGPSNAWRIGLEAPLSGDQETLGEGMLQGAQLAASQINEAGGLLDREVEIVPIDDAADPETGVKAAREALDNGLDAVVGPYNSGVGLETLPIYIDGGLVPIRLTSDTATNGLGFTLQPMTSQIAPVASEAMTEWLGADSVGIIYDDSTAYTKAIEKAVKKDLEGAGVEVSTAAIEPGKTDYSEEVSELAGQGVDVIYLAVYFPEGAKLATEMFDQQVEARCLADYGAYDTGFIEEAGEEVARTCPVVGVPAPDDFEDSALKVKAFEEDFDQDPGTWSPYTYDSVNFLAEGVRQANGFDAGKLKSKLGKVKGWKGWTGTVNIEAKTGNRSPATVVVTRVNDGGQFHTDMAWAEAVVSGKPYREG
jgi:branched-chain amino acid transport system substrate-binding protein